MRSKKKAILGFSSPGVSFRFFEIFSSLFTASAAVLSSFLPAPLFFFLRFLPDELAILKLKYEILFKFYLDEDLMICYSSTEKEV
jgi:hypothetical protein